MQVYMHTYIWLDLGAGACWYRQLARVRCWYLCRDTVEKLLEERLEGWSSDLPLSLACPPFSPPISLSPAPPIPIPQQQLRDPWKHWDVLHWRRRSSRRVTTPTNMHTYWAHQLGKSELVPRHSHLVHAFQYTRQTLPVQELLSHFFLLDISLCRSQGIVSYFYAERSRLVWAWEWVDSFILVLR